MASLSWAAYNDLAKSPRGKAEFPMPMEPAIAEEAVAIGAVSAASNAFPAGTNFVWVSVDVACYVTFGTTPVATSAKKYLPAGAILFFGAAPGMKLAVLAV